MFYIASCPSSEGAIDWGERSVSAGAGLRIREVRSALNLKYCAKKLAEDIKFVIGVYEDSMIFLIHQG